MELPPPLLFEAPRSGLTAAPQRRPATPRPAALWARPLTPRSAQPGPARARGARARLLLPPGRGERREAGRGKPARSHGARLGIAAGSVRRRRETGRACAEALRAGPVGAAEPPCAAAAVAAHGRAGVGRAGRDVMTRCVSPAVRPTQRPPGACLLPGQRVRGCSGRGRAGRRLSPPPSFSSSSSISLSSSSSGPLAEGPAPSLRGAGPCGGASSRCRPRRTIGASAAPVSPGLAYMRGAGRRGWQRFPPRPKERPPAPGRDSPPRAPQRRPALPPPPPAPPSLPAAAPAGLWRRRTKARGPARPGPAPRGVRGRWGGAGPPRALSLPPPRCGEPRAGRCGGGRGRCPAAGRRPETSSMEVCCQLPVLPLDRPVPQHVLSRRGAISFSSSSALFGCPNPRQLSQVGAGCRDGGPGAAGGMGSHGARATRGPAGGECDILRVPAEPASRRRLRCGRWPAGVIPGGDRSSASPSAPKPGLLPSVRLGPFKDGPSFRWCGQKLKRLYWNNKRALRRSVWDAELCLHPTTRTWQSVSKETKLHGFALPWCCSLPTLHQSQDELRGILFHPIVMGTLQKRACGDNREVFLEGTVLNFWDVCWCGCGLPANGNRVTFWYKPLENVWNCRGKRVCWWKAAFGS